MNGFLTLSQVGRLGLLVTLLGIAGPLAAQEKPEHSDAEKAAMAEVKKLGGQVMELAQTDPHLEVAYHLTDGQVGDDHLKPLANMPLLVSINLRGTAITNAGLAHLKQAKSLKRLHLEKTQITDEGLAHLAALENLEYLNLYGTAITDAGLKHLEGLKNLRKLYLWQTKVTDAGVSALKQKLPELNAIQGLSLTPPPEKKEEPKPEEAKKEEKKPEPKKEEPKKEELKKPEPKKEEPKKEEPKKPE